MAYVPGFRNDVFISYAHGDGEPPVSADGKGWVAHLRDRLHAAIRLRLGFSPNIWMDKRDLDPNVNFDNEIHDQLDSAVLILVASPTYIGLLSRMCGLILVPGVSPGCDIAQFP